MLWLEPIFKNQRKDIGALIQESEPLTFYPNDSAASHCCFLEPTFAFVTIFILHFNLKDTTTTTRLPYSYYEL